jgi:fumarylacetoacetase
MILFQMVKTWRLVRNRIAELLMPQTQNNAKDLDIIIFRMEDVEMQLPVLITLIFL